MQPLKILPGRVFDDEKVQNLRRLYLEECMPARECAKRLGLTPKQVRSKVHKLGWSQVRTQVGARTIRRCEEALAKVALGEARSRVRARSRGTRSPLGGHDDARDTVLPPYGTVVFGQIIRGAGAPAGVAAP